MWALHEDVVRRSEDTVVALMIEKRSAVDDLDDLLAVDGVDAVVFGPSDYSLSVGEPGAIDEPVVTEAEERKLDAAREASFEAIVELSDPAAANTYREKYGVSHFNLGVDAAILDDWWRTQGRALRRRLDAD